MSGLTASEPRVVSQRNRHRLQDHFGDKELAFLPAVLAADEGEALRHVDAARHAGADGVFLVSHGIGHRQLLDIARSAIRRHPDYFVGVNCRDLRPQDVFSRVPDGVRGIWSDNPGLERGAGDTMATTRQARLDAGWLGLYFGGIALNEAALETGLKTALRATESIDVLTLGGPTYGKALSANAIRAVRETVGSHPLALASPRPLSQHEESLRQIDCFLAPGWTPRTGQT
jgi:hypothetical protein